MTKTALLTLVAVTAATLVGVGVIHEMQVEERQRLHRGVIRDQELLAKKEAEFRKGPDRHSS